MNTISIGLSVLVLLIGCNGQQVRKDYLTVWRSPTSTPGERMDAVTNLFLVGQTRKEVMRILGSGGEWTHWHGPSFIVVPVGSGFKVEETHDHDYWTLEFKVPGGSAALFFQTRNKTESRTADFRFVRAAFTTVLESVRGGSSDQNNQ